MRSASATLKIISGISQESAFKISVSLLISPTGGHRHSVISSSEQFGGEIITGVFGSNSQSGKQYMQY